MNNNPKTFKVDISIAKESLIKKKSRINTYFEIMQEFNKFNFKDNDNFRKKFNGFYKIIRRSSEFYNMFYYYLEKNKTKNIKYEEVLKYFYDNFGKIEKSFSSKLLATINPNMPVWDSIIISKLGIKVPSYSVKNRFEIVVEIYYKIIEWFNQYLCTDNSKECIKVFDEVFPNNTITNIKKIDLVLWSIRTINKTY
jgi:hypothetical protein